MPTKVLCRRIDAKFLSRKLDGFGIKQRNDSGGWFFKKIGGERCTLEALTTESTQDRSRGGMQIRGRSFQVVFSQ